MHVKKSLLILTTLFILTTPLYAGDVPPVKGRYIEVPGHQFEFDGEKVEVIEFLSFYCGHCYHFERSVPVIRGNFPGKINWKVIPIYWGNGSPKPGEAYLLAEEAGKGEQMKKAIFNAIFVEKKNISSIEVLEELAAGIGLGEDFGSKLRSGEKAGNAGGAILMANSYGINETPALVIAGNLKSSPGMFSDLDEFRQNTITIIKSILGK